MTELSVPTLILLLLIASVVAMLSRRAGLPYSAGLVAAGIVLALLPIDASPRLSRDLIYQILLPPLIFEASLQLDWRRFRRELPLTLVLAFAGVPIAAAVVAGGMHLLLGWSWIGAALFGTLIAATDPVAVIAAFKELSVAPRLGMVVEAESLLNDGVAVVGFGVLLGVAGGETADAFAIAGDLLWTVLVGIASGGVVAGSMLILAGRTSEPLIEVTLTTVAAFGSFLLAEHFAASGVLASLTAGLMVGNLGWMGSISDQGRRPVLAFWEYAAFLANSLIFILIGVHEAHQPISAYGYQALTAIALVLGSRMTAVYPLSSFFAPTKLKLPPTYQHVLFWGGLRGALALALALALPTEIAERREIIVISFAVVAFSVFVQGLTIPLLLRRLKLVRGPDPHSEGPSNSG